MLEHAVSQRPGDSVAGGGTARVDDATPIVAAFEPEAVVELDTELDEIANPCRRFLRERYNRARPAEAAPRSHRVRGMELGSVVLADGRRDSPLCERARGCEERALGHEHHIRLGRGAQGSEQARDAAPDHQEVCPILCLRSPRVTHASFRRVVFA